MLSDIMGNYQVGHKERLVGVAFDVWVIVWVPYKRTSRARVSDQFKETTKELAVLGENP